MSENNVGILSAPNGDGANIKIEHSDSILLSDIQYLDLKPSRDGIVISPTNNLSSVYILGCSHSNSWKNGSWIRLSGKDCFRDGDYLNGNMSLFAANGINQSCVRLAPTGEFYIAPESYKEFPILSVDSYISEDGNSWYRKYSDGWIEQGGKLIGNATINYVDVTFPIVFSNIPKLVISFCAVTDDWFTNTNTLTTATFSNAAGIAGTTTTTKTRFSSYSDKYWYACGY